MRTWRASKPESPTAIVVTWDSYKYATRARKSAVTYAAHGEAVFLGLAAVGRSGRWDEAGRWHRDGVDVIQLAVRRPWTGTGRKTQIANLLFVYIPAFMLLAFRTLRQPADIVHITGIALGPIGAVHTLFHGSRMVFDITERPGLVTQKQSLTSLIRHFEPMTIKSCRRFTSVATVVTLGDVETLQKWRYRDVHFLPNAPLEGWRASYIPPDRTPSPLVLILVGTIFEGRGYEMVLEAFSRTIRDGLDVSLRIAGGGRTAYVESLKRLTGSLEISERVQWVGSIDGSEVSATYLSGDIGLVLYESNDPGNDGLSNKLMECVSSGRPVIATDLPENRRFVTQYDVGWLSKATVEDLSSAIARAFGSSERTAISQRCRNLGDSELTWERRFEPLLQKLKSASS